MDRVTCGITGIVAPSMGAALLQAVLLELFGESPESSEIGDWIPCQIPKQARLYIYLEFGISGGCLASIYLDDLQLPDEAVDCPIINLCIFDLASGQIPAVPPGSLLAEWYALPENPRAWRRLGSRCSRLD